jgi:hypothetical protein
LVFPPDLHEIRIRRGLCSVFVLAGVDRARWRCGRLDEHQQHFTLLEARGRRDDLPLLRVMV